MILYIYIVLSLLVIFYLIKENRRLKRYEENYKASIYKIVKYINLM